MATNKHINYQLLLLSDQRKLQNVCIVELIYSVSQYQNDDADNVFMISCYHFILNYFFLLDADYNLLDLKSAFSIFTLVNVVKFCACQM